jgi:hypothetical protein
MRIKITSGKFAQRHWIVNCFKDLAKNSWVYYPIDFGDTSEALTPREKDKVVKSVRRRKLWKFAQDFIDECLEEFNIDSVKIERNGICYNYYRGDDSKPGHFGRPVTKSHVPVDFLPYSEEIYKIIKKIFKQHWDGHSEKINRNRNELRKQIAASVK